MTEPTQLIEQLARSVELSVPYLEIASRTTHDGTGGEYKRLEAKRRLELLTAALTAARAHLEQPEPSMAVGQLYEARFKRLVAMEASLAPEDRIAYYVRNPHELDRLIKLDELAKDRP